MMEKYNRYILILKNTYTKKVEVLDVYNKTESKSYYEFTFEKEIDDGTYEYFLIYCPSDYTLEISPNVIDSKISTSSETFTVGEVISETGLMKFGAGKSSSYTRIEDGNSFVTL